MAPWIQRPKSASRNRKRNRAGAISSAVIGKGRRTEDGSRTVREHGWRELDDIYSATSEPSWNNIAATVPGGTWLQSTVYDSREDALVSLELLAKKQLYVLKAGHVIDILRTKYPAGNGEGLVEHFERALTGWIATYDMEFTCSVLGVQREPPKERI